MRWSWTRWSPRRVDLCPRPCHHRVRSCIGCDSGRGQSFFEVVEARTPALFVGASRFLIPEVAVLEAHRGDALGLLEVELDQRFSGLLVPGPGEGQAGGRVDLGVLTSTAVFCALLGVAHDHAYGAADSQVDLGVGGLPVVPAVE